MCVVGATLLFRLWPRTIPAEQCSGLYQKYSGRDDIDTTFIKGKQINDILFLDVTLLEAADSAGWNAIRYEFNIPYGLDSLMKPSMKRGKKLISVKLVDKKNYRNLAKNDSPDCEVIGISVATHTVSLFHTKNKEEVRAVLHHNIRISTNQ